MEEKTHQKRFEEFWKKIERQIHRHPVMGGSQLGPKDSRRIQSPSEKRRFNLMENWKTEDRMACVSFSGGVDEDR